MSQSEKHSFEEEWRHQLESADETPPPSVWKAVEAHLDGQETTVLPLVWWKNPKVQYRAAAAVALLLLSWPVLQLTWSGSPQGDVSGVVAPEVPGPRQAKSAAGDSSAETAIKPHAASTSDGGRFDSAPSGERVAFSEKAGAVGPAPPARPSRSESTLAGKPAEEIAALSASASQVPEQKTETVHAERISSADARIAISGIAPLSPARPGLPDYSTARSGFAQRDVPMEGLANTPDKDQILRLPLETLLPTQPTEQAIRVQKRYVHFVYEAPEGPVEKHSRIREVWAGVGIMPASFNPKMNVTAAPMAFANANAGRQSMANASQSQLSYAVQAQGGTKLSKHWSVETGISYLQGNSTFQSDGYILDAATSRSANVLEDALVGGSSLSSNADFVLSLNGNSSSNKTANLYIDLDQRTSNDYRYVQLPLQAGYTIHPDGKLNYTILGGLVANLFLQNEIQTGSNAAFRNSADDGLYRSLNWSAATGVRVSYRLSDHWDATLTGSYQKAVASVLRNSSTLDSRPQLYGMAWGVRYVF